jgi:hypothetical protein
MTRKKRRVRSEMTIQESQRAISSFFDSVERISESNSIDCVNFAPNGKLYLTFLFNGTYGAPNDFIEALRVMSSHKLPRKE